MQMEGFGSASLLTAAEEKKLGRQLQALLALEVVRKETMERLGREISSSEWMAECEVTDAKAFRKTVKVRFVASCQQAGLVMGSCHGEQACLEARTHLLLESARVRPKLGSRFPPG